MRRHVEVFELAEVPDLLDVLERSDGGYAALVENAAEPQEANRWSYLCLDPRVVFRAVRGRCWAGPPGRLRLLPGGPFVELASLLEGHRVPAGPWPSELPPFRGGAVGWLGYEMAHLLEDVDEYGGRPGAVPDCTLFLCDTVVATDLVERRSVVIANGFGPDGQTARDRARLHLASSVAGLGPAIRPPTAGRPEAAPPLRRLREDDLRRASIRPVVDRRSYVKAVKSAQDHIEAGDVYEVCLTQRFDVDHDGCGLDLYRALRRASPAPHAAYIRTPEVELLSASPERFLRLDDDGVCETSPIKGTRPRGLTPDQDSALAAELAASEKDAAENLMIVDLARNDLGRVCEYGTVSVPRLRVVESHAQTHQLVSTVTGRLRRGLGPVDLVRAAFPGGSMTGAPKVAAMKMIQQFEPVPRGPYAGSMGWFDYDGGLDLNIVIRTFVKHGSALSFNTGGAIVADSDPADEYQESLDKAAGLVAALHAVRTGGG